MAGEQTQETIDRYPKIGGPYSDNDVGISDIWPWPYCGDVDEGIEEGFCTEEKTDGVTIIPRPPHPLSDWLWVIAAYAIVVVPFVAAVIRIFFWARQN